MTEKLEYSAADMASAAAGGWRDGQRAAAEAAQSAPAGEREAFEAWAEERRYSTKTDNIGYCHPSTTEVSRAFKAGAAWQRTQAAGVPHVSAMARVISDRAADACNIDRTDNWAMYGQEYIEDVQAMLAAAPAQPAVQDQGVVQRLREALGDARELIGHGDFSTGFCMCGSGVDGHTIGDGHAPTDEGDYYAGEVMERIDAALAAHRAGGA